MASRPTIARWQFMEPHVLSNEDASFGSQVKNCGPCISTYFSLPCFARYYVAIIKYMVNPQI